MARRNNVGVVVANARSSSSSSSPSILLVVGLLLQGELSPVFPRFHHRVWDGVRNERGEAMTFLLFAVVVVFLLFFLLRRRRLRRAVVLLFSGGKASKSVVFFDFSSARRVVVSLPSRTKTPKEGHLVVAATPFSAFKSARSREDDDDEGTVSFCSLKSGAKNIARRRRKQRYKNNTKNR